MTSLALVYDMQSTTFTWLIGVSSLRMNKSRFCFCAHFVYFCSWPCAFVCEISRSGGWIWEAGFESTMKLRSG